jgi:hypothetical protein
VGPCSKDAVAEISHLIVQIETRASGCCSSNGGGGGCCAMGGFACFAMCVLAYLVGGAVSGWTLGLIAVIALSLTPVALTYDVHVKVDRAVRPHIEMVSGKVSATLAPVTAFVKARLGKGGDSKPAQAAEEEEPKKDK